MNEKLSGKGGYKHKMKFDVGKDSFTAFKKTDQSLSDVASGLLFQVV